MPLWRRTSAAAGPASDSASAEAFEPVSGFTDLQRVGSGGFSTVYRARQEKLERTVALKVLAVEFVDAQVRRRFLREVQLASRLTEHPNVVTVLEAGMTAAGRPYIAMEYFSRGSAADRLATDGPLPVSEVLDIGAKIADALAAAHELGIVHRDVKPQNILISKYGEPALADFGTARLTAGFDVSARTEALTPFHAAPEVLRGEQGGPQCDVYSLGSTLYHLLAGRPAYRDEGDGVAGLLLRAVSEAPPPISRAGVGEEVMAVVLRAMAKEPLERFDGAAELAAALRAVRDGGPARSASAGSAGAIGSAAGQFVAAADLQDEAGEPPHAIGSEAEEQQQAIGFEPILLAAADRQDEAEEQSQVIGFEPITSAAELKPSSLDMDTHPRSSTGPSAPDPPATPSPAPASAPLTNRKALMASAIGIAAATAAAAPIFLTHAAHSGHPTPPSPAATTPASAAAPSAPPTSIDPAQARPADVTAHDQGSTVYLQWRLAGPPYFTLLVETVPANGKPTMGDLLSAGTTSTAVTGLNPSLGYCFVVGSVVTVGTTEPQPVWSAPTSKACVRGAVPGSQ